MGIYQSIRCMIGLHLWGEWNFVDDSTGLQVTSCLQCFAEKKRDVFTSLSDSNVKTKALEFVPDMLEMKPDSFCRTDDYGGGYTENVELFVVGKDGNVQQLDGKLGSFPAWQACRFFVIRKSSQTKTYWGQQRDGNIDGFDVTAETSIEYAKICTTK